MKVYVLIKLMNDLYMEDTILAVCKTRESAIKLAVMCNDYDIKEYELME